MQPLEVADSQKAAFPPVMASTPQVCVRAQPLTGDHGDPAHVSTMLPPALLWR